MRSLRCLVLACLSLVLACAEEEPPESCPDQQPTLEFVNSTGNQVEALHFFACDMSEQSDYPLPSPLPNGGTVSIPFPGPGCWYVEYEGDGCESEEPRKADDLFCDDTFEWIADDDNHVCIG